MATDKKTQVELVGPLLSPNTVLGDILNGVSPILSQTLRRAGRKKGLSIQPYGFVLLDELLGMKNIESIGVTLTLPDVQELVDADSKQRCSFRTDSRPGDDPC